MLDLITRNSRTPDERQGDLSAQIAAQRIGARRLRELAARYGHATCWPPTWRICRTMPKRMVRGLIRAMPPGRFTFRDVMDDDGFGTEDIPIQVRCGGRRR